MERAQCSKPVIEEGVDILELKDRWKEFQQDPERWCQYHNGRHSAYGRSPRDVRNLMSEWPYMSLKGAVGKVNNKITPRRELVICLATKRI